MNKQTFYITTAIAYASGKPHIGNTYEIIMSDAVARYKRARDYDVFLCTGTDEHGQKIENKAKAAGVTPQQFVDGVSGEIRGIWDRMNASYDHFIRTTDDYHVKAVQKIFKRFFDQGDIYKGYYEGWYCEPDEAFITDSQVVDGKCPDCGRPLVRAREESYYFRMSKYADRLIDYINEHPEFIEPELRKKEMINNFLLVDGGLQDLCVSRTSFTWGIPVLFDPKHVTYVWLDALTNYITAIGYDPDKTYEEQSDFFKSHWPADVHIIGKDILRFHTIYWPIFLMALDLPLPKKVFGHPWFNFGTDKMSKSRGNVIYADTLADHFTVDGVRYYALSEMPYASDGSVTIENVVRRYNTDLVNNLGNLVKRTLDMQKKYFDRVIQKPGEVTELDRELREMCVETTKNVCAHMDTYHVADAMADIMALLSRANKYIDETTPWTLAKDETQRERLGTVLYNLLSVIHWAAVVLNPFLPETSEKILRMIGAKKAVREIEAHADAHRYISYASFAETPESFETLVPGDEVEDSVVLFARADEQKEVEAFFPKEEVKNEEPKKIQIPEGIARIGIDDFMKVELRTAQVIRAAKVEKAKKLLCLELDLGYEKRQVVSGIAKFYQPEDLVGKKVIVVSNLKPAVLCGMESNGMILASGEEQIRVVFLSDDTPLGERVR